MKITAVLDRFEGDMAVLLLKSNEIEEEIPAIWPKKYLPPAKEGHILKISLEIDETGTQEVMSEHEKLLKMILEQQK